MTASLQEFEDRYVLPTEGAPIGRIAVDFRLTFDFGEFRLVCETGFTVEDEGQSHWGDPEDKATLLPALRLFNRRVETAIAYKNGQLRLLFEDGAALRILPNPRYEAWQLNGADGLLIVAMPGGELAVWSTPEQRSIEWLPARKPPGPP